MHSCQATSPYDYTLVIDAFCVVAVWSGEISTRTWPENCQLNLTAKVQQTQNSKCIKESYAVWSKNSTDVEWQQTIWIAVDTISRPRCKVSWYKFYRYTVYTVRIHVIYAAVCPYVRTYMHTDTRQLQHQDCLPIYSLLVQQVWHSFQLCCHTCMWWSPLPTGVVMWPACDLYTGTLHRGERYKLKPHLPCHPTIYTQRCKDHSCVYRSMICGGQCAQKTQSYTYINVHSVVEDAVT